MPLVSKNFSDIITFTRASSATYFDSAGVLQTATTDAPRFDYNPSTLAAQGLLIEEARTNSIRNNTMVGAVAGTPGTLPTNWVAGATSNGLSRQIVGTGTENGITYVDIRYSGTTTSASLTAIYWETATGVAATSGQVWTNSAYVSLVGGSTANITNVVIGIDENNSGGGYLTGSTTVFSPSSGSLSGKRYSHTRTLNNASTAYVWAYVFFSYGNGAAIDITLRIGLPQLELGAFATSVIPTTSTAVTRAADVASVNTLSPWFNAAEGTLYADYFVNPNAAAPVIWHIDNSSTNNLRLRYLSNQHQAFSIVSNVTVAQVYDQTGTSQTTARTAFAYKDSDFAARTNGGASPGATADDNSGAVPSGLNTLRFGTNVAGTSYINGYLRRITYYPRRLSNTELQAITA